MLKLVLLIVAVWVVLTVLRQRRRPVADKTNVDNMVRCAVCQVHLPESEAIVSQGRHYCSEAHFLERDQA